MEIDPSTGYEVALTVRAYNDLHSRINRSDIDGFNGTSNNHVTPKVEQDNDQWRLLAKCRGEDTKIFYDKYRASLARAICKECIVRQDCLDYSISNDEKFGIWGGVSERSRRRMILDKNRNKN